MEKKNQNKIVVERETYDKDGKSYFSYFIKGNIRGKDVRVLVTPPDKGGYAVLDIVLVMKWKPTLLQTLMKSRTIQAMLSKATPMLLEVLMQTELFMNVISNHSVNQTKHFLICLWDKQI